MVRTGGQSAGAAAAAAEAPLLTPGRLIPEGDLEDVEGLVALPDDILATICTQLTAPDTWRLAHCCHRMRSRLLAAQDLLARTLARALHSPGCLAALSALGRVQQAVRQGSLQAHKRAVPHRAGSSRRGSGLRDVSAALRLGADAAQLHWLSLGVCIDDAHGVFAASPTGSAHPCLPASPPPGLLLLVFVQRQLVAQLLFRPPPSTRPLPRSFTHALADSGGPAHACPADQAVPWPCTHTPQEAAAAAMGMRAHAVQGGPGPDPAAFPSTPAPFDSGSCLPRTASSPLRHQRCHEAAQGQSGQVLHPATLLLADSVDPTLTDTASLAHPTPNPCSRMLHRLGGSFLTASAGGPEPLQGLDAGEGDDLEVPHGLRCSAASVLRLLRYCLAVNRRRCTLVAVVSVQALAVADLCAVLPAPDQPLCSNRAHGQRLPAGCCPAVPAGPPPGQPATSPDRAQQQQQGPISPQPCAGYWAVPQANSVQEAEAGMDVEEGAHPPSAGVASGSRELAVSVRRAVQLLPSWAPGVQLLLLPALLPTTGRAAVRGPARSSSAGPTASRVSAPRLLQLSVPVFSELRCTLTEAYSAARSAGLDNSTGDYAAPGGSVMPFTDGGSHRDAAGGGSALAPAQSAELCDCGVQD
ncbi:hypothetical protein QJQ45_006879 [Haematococcus lacustris]|nr:hypothetical protein QJQ45_006879 [Haematococcus lacustris]